MDNIIYNNDIDMATIPYIAHEKAMWKAHTRYKKTVVALIASNVMWAILFVLKLGGWL